MMNALNKNKNNEVKTIEANSDTQMEHNEDFNNKLREEIEKHDKLLGELIEGREELKRKKELQEETKAQIEI